MNEILSGKPGQKLLLLGNEAIVRGAVEAGLGYASSYPGTPSSEVPDTLFALRKDADYYFEYGTNEKVAFESAGGAALTGATALTTMKHVGLNVAADPMMTLAYVGIPGAMVIYNADDPSMFSSQNEQDNRYYAKISGLPMLEPSDSQEMKDFTVFAFELSKELGLPIFLRSTTRIAHTRSQVKIGPVKPAVTKGSFEKSPFTKVPVPAVARMLHPKFLEKQEKALQLSNNSKLNKVYGKGSLGIITGSVSFNYVMDALDDLGMKNQVSVLKLGWAHPLPDRKIINFMKNKEKVLVVEELEPVFEDAIRALAQKNSLTLPILGKDGKIFTRLFEYDPALVRKGIAKAFKLRPRGKKPVDLSDLPALPGRPPNLCAGCPHRMTYYAVKQAAGDEVVYGTDIGCYTLGLLPPYSMADFLLCMGSSASAAGGVATAGDKRVISFIGDSTLYHSGLTGIVNSVHNRHKFTLVILDNGTTAMTGHQPHPGMDVEMAGIDDRSHVDIEKAVRGLGVEHVAVVKPKNLKKTEAAVKEALAYDGFSVIISQEICPLYGRRYKKPTGLTFTVDRDKCKNHRTCVNKFACPAFFLEDGKVMIDENLCIGCAVCVQVCPEKAIVRRAN
jgi:indolepyruvate ferredoxin oxidoreductase, alpha subunit